MQTYLFLMQWPEESKKVYLSESTKMNFGLICTTSICCIYNLYYFVNSIRNRNLVSYNANKIENGTFGLGLVRICVIK